MSKSTPDSQGAFAFSIPKLCECGCGQPVSYAKTADPLRGILKGQPNRFINGHGSRLNVATAGIVDLNPSGLCQCGCGRNTPISDQTSRTYGWVKGEPKKFCLGHRIHPPYDAKTFFLRHVRKVGPCLLWTGYVHPRNGYGHFRYNGEVEGAHRVAWILANGPIPEGQDVCHTCDVFYGVGDSTYRRCVLLEHLELGTPSDNMTHCVDSGRGVRGRTRPAISGSNSGMAKLTEEKVRHIREAVSSGTATRRELAQIYNVSKGLIDHVVTRKIWRHVT